MRTGFPARAAAIAVLMLTTLLAAASSPFRWEATTAGDQLTVSLRVEAGHYLYAQSLALEVTGSDGKAASPLLTPEPENVDDPFFGRIGIYPEGSYRWTFRGMPPFQATVDFQGCRKAAGNEAALCFMPQHLALTDGETPPEEAEGALEDEKLDSLLERFRLERRTIGFQDAAQFRAFLSPASAPIAAGKSGDAGLSLADRSAILVILLTILGGLGLNLTPCVLPMIPVNLAIIGADGGNRAAGFRRGLAYGIGMAAAYGVLGVLVILTGARFGALNATSWFNFTIAGIFLVLAAAMFGWFNVDLSGLGRVKPSRIRGGKTVVAFVMGAVAALLAGACVAPVVIMVLVFAAERYQAGNFFALGLPFLLGVGMALPWPLAGAGLAVLPKPGRFMIAVKYLFGAVILAAAVFYGVTGWRLLPGSYSPEAEVEHLRSRLALALEERKPVLIVFWATWCKNCVEMEKEVLPAPEVQKELERYTLVHFQAEDPSDPAVAGLMNRWELPGLPAFVILTPR